MSRRLSFARWLMSKLLGSLFIYFILFWLFPMLQIDWTKMNFFQFYGWIVGTLFLASLISYLLITPPRIREKKKIVPVKQS